MNKPILLLTAILVLALQGFAAPRQDDPVVEKEFDKNGKLTLIHQNFNDPVFPPPGYQNIGVVDTARWALKVAGTMPSALPQDGVYLISYNSLSEEAGDAAALITPAINIPASGYRVRFSMYRDGSYPTAADRIEVLVNTKAMMNGATSLGVVHRSLSLSPVESAEGWHYYDFPITQTGDVYIIFKAISGFGANLHMDAFFVEQIPAGVPSLGIIPETVDFGKVPAGYDGESRVIRLFNIGVGTLTIPSGGVVLSGAGAGAYALGSIAYPIELDKYESYPLNLSFLPVSAGIQNAQLEITHNGNNNPTAIAVTGEGYAPLSYFMENFDGVNAPFLPGTWKKAIQSTSTNATVEAYVLADPYSLPNHVRMNNGADVAATVMLISPAVTGFDENWLGFSVKTFSLNQMLRIGTVADPRQPETFEQIDYIIVPTNTYTRYYLSLDAYTGTNKYIAFKHGLGGTNRSIYIDDVVWEPIPPDPVFSVSPPQKDYGDVMVGASSAQVFTITNTSGGTLTIHPENINLTGTDASDFILTGLSQTVTLEFGESATVSVAFAPLSEGIKSASLNIEDNLGLKVLNLVPLSGRGYPGTITAFPWTETFEDQSLSRPAWTQVKMAGNASWTYSAGSSGGAILTAFEGSKNARFVSVSGTNTPITRLITPWLNLSGLASPSLIFYLGQQDWVGDQNETKVYYRTSEGSSWIELAHYTESLSTWTRKLLSLPAPSASYQLAFEGINNYGRANVLDLVRVCPVLLPVSVSITADDTDVCQGTPVTFTATAVNGGEMPVYQWKVNGQNAGTNSPEFSYAPANNDQVWVELTSSEPCAENNPVQSNQIVMTVHPTVPVSVSISASQTTVCQGTSVTFTASPVNGGSSPAYQWKKNGVNAGTGGPTYTYTPVNGDQISLVLTSSEPCTTGNPATSNTITMTVNNVLPVSVSITSSHTEVCQGTIVTYTASPVNGGTSPTYQWKKNGINVGTGGSTYSYAPADGDQVWVVLTSSLPCASGNPATSNTITMAVNPLLPVSVSISASQTTVCQGTSVTFTASPVNGGTSPSYQWKKNGTNVGTGGPTYTYTPVNGDQVSVVLTSSEVCTSGNPATSNTLTMTVNPLLPVSVSISASQTTVCQGTSVTFTASPVNGGTSPSYQWKKNGTNVGTDGPTYTYTPVNGDQVLVVLTSSEVCTSGNPATSNTITMTVNPLLPVSVSISASQTTVCQGTSVTFTASPVNGGSSPAYQWKKNGTNVGSGGPTYTYTPVNGDQVWVVLTSSETCTTGNPATSNTIAMTVNPILPVSVSISASQTTVCQGTSVTFTASPVNGGSSPAYQWKKNGTNVGTGGPTYTYTPVNGDQVSVVLTSSETCTTGNPATSNTIAMTVNPILPVSVSISASQTTVCQGTSVTFTASPVNGGSSPAYQWKKNGTNVGTGGPTYTYTPVNGDQVSVVLTSSETCTTGNPATSNTITMTVNPILPVSVSITASQTTVCQGTSVTFTASPVNGGSSPAYQWKKNGTNVGSGGPTYTYTPVNGDQVSVVLTSSETCTTGNPATSNTIAMTVNPILPVSVSISASQTTVCQGTSVTFTATPVNGGTSPSYQWKKNGTNVGSGGPTYTYTPVNGDQVWVVLTSSETCTTGNPATSNTITMTVNPILPVSVSITASQTTVCQGTSVTFTASPVNGGSSPAYQWKKNGTNVGGGGSTYTYTPANGDQISVVMTSSETCTTGNPATSNTITMTVNPLLPVSVSISASQTTVCQGISVTFTASPVNGGSSPAYQWKKNGTNVGTGGPTYTYIPVNGDQVWVVLTSSETCTTGNPATSNTITMTVNPILPVSVSITASQTTVCQGTAVTFNATPVNGGTNPVFQWKKNGVNAGSGGTSFTYTPANGDQITVVLTSSETCTTGNPATSNSITMTVNPLLPVSVSITASQTTVCQGTPVTFTATPVNGGASPSYQWKRNGINVGSGGPSYTYTPVNGDLVSVVLTSSETCTTGNPATSNTITMTVNPLLPVSVSISASQTTVCQGTSVTFTATPVNGGITPAYQWKKNGVNVGSGGPTYTYTPANGDQISVVMTSSETCTTGNPATSNTLTMTVNPLLPVSVSITASQTTVCQGTPVTLTAIPVNGGSTPTFQWKKNGTNAGTGGSSYTYTPVNGDQISVVLTSSESCTTGNPATSNTITMTVNPLLPVSVSISASQTTVCQGTPVTFTATPVNGGASPAFQWKKNGTNVGGGGPTYTYTPIQGDQISVVLTSSESCTTGNPATSNTITMTVNPLLAVSVNVSASALVVSEGTQVTFTAQPQHGGTSPQYQWMVNGGPAGTNSPSYAYVPSNGDQVWVILTSSETCTTGNPATSNTLTLTVFGANGFQLDIKVVLEGPFNNAGNGILMGTTLASGGDVPLAQPFGPTLPYYGNNSPVWYYTGTESLGSLPAGTVDWVLVELRDAPSPEQAVPGTSIARQPALLLNTGQIMGIPGTLPTFDLSFQHQLFVVIYHRNHLAVMSSEALTLVEGVYSWDFSLSAKKAYADPNRSSYQDGQKHLGGVIYGMFGGDGDGNGQVQTQDKNGVWNTQSGLSGYLPGDFDLNGQVQTQDKNGIWNPNSGMASQIPVSLMKAGQDEP